MKVVSFTATTPTSVIKHVTAGQLFVVPYDSHPGSKLPVTLHGNSAHYGVAIGVCFRPSFTVDDIDAATPAVECAPLPEGAGDDAVGTALGPLLWNPNIRADAAALEQPLAGDEVLLVVQHSNSSRLSIVSNICLGCVLLVARS
jgi:hypothetical protein